MATGGQQSQLNLSMEQDTPLDLSMEHAPDSYHESLMKIIDSFPLKDLTELKQLEDVLSCEESFERLKKFLIENCVSNLDHTTDKDFFYMMLKTVISQKLKENKDFTYHGKLKSAVGLKSLILFKAVQEVYTENKKTHQFDNIESLSKNWLQTNPR